MDETPDFVGDQRTFWQQLYRDCFFEAYSNQAQYGRWILASLLAVHGGGLFAISQAGSASERLFIASGPYLLWGIASALVCGGMAWINFSVAMNVYAMAMRSAGEGKQMQPKGIAVWIVQATLWGTPLLAIGSLVLFIMASVRALAAV